MAHGYWMVTGRPQAVMVHVDVGVANALVGVMNAARARAPLLFTSGRTPFTESGHRGSRDLPIHWGQEMRDQGALVREHVKWEHELVFGDQVELVVDRALAIAAAAPRGPVYLSLPRETLAAPWGDAALAAAPAQSTPSAARPDPGRDRARGGPDCRGAATAHHQRRLHHRLRVGPGRVRGPVRDSGGRAVVAHQRDRDRSSDARRVRSRRAARRGRRRAGARRAGAVGAEPAASRRRRRGDPDRARSQLRRSAAARSSGRRSRSRRRSSPRSKRWERRSIAGCAGARPAEGSIRERTARLADRGRHRGRRASERPLRSRHDERVAADRRVARASSRAGGPLDAPPAPAATKAWISRHLDRAIAPELDKGRAWLFHELGCDPSVMRFPKPDTLFGLSIAGALGWALPAALGAQLAARDQLVVAAVGDGSYTFANPVACHQMAAQLDLPVLTVVFDNQGWQAVRMATLAIYPQGRRRAGRRDAAHVARAVARLRQGDRGERRPWRAGRRSRRFPAALERALDVVRRERRQALVQVRFRWVDRL